MALRLSPGPQAGSATVERPRSLSLVTATDRVGIIIMLAGCAVGFIALHLAILAIHWFEIGFALVTQR
jgi:hypothetical protein